MSYTLATLKQRFQTLIGDKDGTYTGRYTDAINNAALELYPDLYKKLADDTLIGDNILPPFHWTTTSTLDIYTEPTGTLAKTTTAGYYRHASGSAKIIASGADDALVLDSNVYPRLLDLMGSKVTLKCWALAEVANDSYLDIITTDSDGSDTTQSSTTTSTAGVFTLIKIEDYSVPDDIVRLRIKFRVHTSTKYVYFDPPRLTGKGVYQYLLPYNFQGGAVSKVKLQSSSYSDDACDDLHPQYKIDVFGWQTFTEDGYKYIDFSNSSLKPFEEQRIQLIGMCPLESLSADTDTMTIEEKYIPRLLTYAAYWMYQTLEGTPASDDISRYERASMKWRARSEALNSVRMPRLPKQINWRL